MSRDELRHYPNPYKDLSDGKSDVVDIQNGTLLPSFRAKVEKSVDSLLKRLESSVDRSGLDWSDHSVYTGVSGLALLYLHLSEKRSQPAYLDVGLGYLEKVLPHLKGRRLSFLCGDPGPLALAAVLYHRKGEQEKARRMVQRLLSLLPDVIQLDSDLPDELLYGRAGYLFSLLLIQRELGSGAVEEQTVQQVVEAILLSGQRLSKQEKRRSCPLMYQWHGKHYLGAAHGLSGILSLLLQYPGLTHSQQTSLLRPTLDYLLGLRFPSGNFPSSLGNDTDRLVHWCHGAPGAMHCFALASQVFHSEEYLSAAKKAGEVVWERGILTKGYGICHGVSGNTYTFLHLFKLTKDVKHLHRACKFAEWCFDYGKNCCRTPDRPLSLFEGLAGAVYMLADLLDPDNAKYPAFIL